MIGQRLKHFSSFFKKLKCQKNDCNVEKREFSLCDLIEILINLHLITFFLETHMNALRKGKRV